MTFLTLLACAGVVAGHAHSAVASAAAQDRTAIVADRVVMPDGSLGESMAVIIADGRIESVVSADAVPAGVEVLRRSGVLSPGLIDAFGQLGASGDARSTVETIEPHVSARDGIAPSDPLLTEALHAGVTTAVISPSADNVVSGAAAAVRTHARNGRLDVLTESGPIVFAFGPSVWNADREPTSRPGALFLLRQALDAAGEGEVGDPLHDVIEGDRGAYAVCGDAEDVLSALNVFARFGVQPVVVHDRSLGDVADALGETQSIVIVGPLGFGVAGPAAEGVVQAEAAGATVAFAGGLGRRAPDALRMTAAIACRYGMNPQHARRALTINSARAAGIAARVGAIESGKAADLVLFSDDPLRPDARVLEVWVAGERVYAAPAEPTGDGDEVFIGGAGHAG